MGYEITEIKRIEIAGPKRFEYIERSRAGYYVQRNAWRVQREIELPPWERISEHGNLNDLRILCVTLSVFIKLKDSSWLEFIFEPGFITDFASVPWYFRNIVDNDDHRVAPAALIHDYLFATHRLPFKQTNDLFHKILLDCGYPRWRARLAYWAVSSFVGRRRWRAFSCARDKWSDEYASMVMPRPVLIDGHTYKGSK